MGRKILINTIARQNYIDQFPELINIKAVASYNYQCNEVLRLRVSNLVHGKNAMSNQIMKFLIKSCTNSSNAEIH